MSHDEPVHFYKKHAVTGHTVKMFHCCMTKTQKESALSPCYASSLLSGSIEKKIADVEEQGLLPCITGWCNIHHRISFIYQDEDGDFPCPSAYYTHMLTLSALEYLKR